MSRTERRLEREFPPVAPYGAVLSISALRDKRGRQTTLPQDWLFEVSARWCGPPARGFPPSAEPVNGNDLVIVKTLQAANRTADIARRRFAAGDVPDLREIAGLASAAA